MTHAINFGSAAKAGAAPARRAPGKLRLAVLGDFSGRANRGLLDKGEALARRKPIKLDVDNIEDVLARFAPVLTLPLGAGGTIEFQPKSIDDLHPDALYENLEIFAELNSLRRRLSSTKTFKAAADEVMSWGGAAEQVAATSRRSRGNALRIDAKLSDFARLVGAPTVSQATPSAVDELLQRVVGPYVVEGDDPDQAALVAIVDRALGAAMSEVLHHPDFQSLEAAWRSLDFLVRRIETSVSLQLVIFDVSAEEFAADLSAVESIDDSGLYKLLVEAPALDADQGSFSAIIANYTFEMTPPHAELLGRAAHLAAQAQAPFIAAIGTDCIATRLEDLHPRVVEAWDALRALPQAGFLALATPRFLLRAPYGEKSDSISSFDYEEFGRHAGLKALLWGNPSIIAAVLLAATFQAQGAKMKLGSVLGLDDMAYFFYEDEDGEQVAFPCTERMLTEKRASHVTGQNLMALLALKGRPEVRLAGFGSVAGGTLLGQWAAPDKLVMPAAGAAPAPVAVVHQTAPIEAARDEAFEAQVTDLEAAAASAPVAVEAEATEEESIDPELDALLAELEASATPEPAAEDEIDPELAALLAELE